MLRYIGYRREVAFFCDGNERFSMNEDSMLFRLYVAKEADDSETFHILCTGLEAVQAYNKKREIEALKDNETWHKIAENRRVII